MSKLKLFWSIGSQPGRAVKTLLDIGKIEHEEQRINVPKAEHKSEQFLKMYPLGLIPVIKDGDFVLGQSSAILTYLCQKYSQISYYHGRNIKQRAFVNQYISWYQNSFRPAMFKPFRTFLTANISRKSIDQQKMMQLWKAMWISIHQFDHLLNTYGGHYIGGNNPSIADLLFYYELTNLQYYKCNHDKYHGIAKWYKRVDAIPEVRNIMSEWEPMGKERSEVFYKIYPIKEKYTEK